MPLTVALALVVALVAGAVWFGIWTWRRLWRPSIASNSYSVLVYRLGVRGFGLFMLVTMTFVVPLVEAETPLRSTLASPAFWAEMILYAIIGAPMWLWAGYWWGRIMAWFFGLPRATSPLHRDRPQN